MRLPLHSVQGATGCDTARRHTVRSLLLPMSMMVMLGFACCRASSNQLARWLKVSRLAHSREVDKHGVIVTREEQRPGVEDNVAPKALCARASQNRSRPQAPLMYEVSNPARRQDLQRRICLRCKLTHACSAPRDVIHKQCARCTTVV